MKNEDTHHGQPIEEHEDVLDVWRSHNLHVQRRLDGMGHICGLHFDEVLDLEMAENEALTLVV